MKLASYTQLQITSTWECYLDVCFVLLATSIANTLQLAPIFLEAQVSAYNSAQHALEYLLLHTPLRIEALALVLACWERPTFFLRPTLSISCSFFH